MLDNFEEWKRRVTGEEPLKEENDNMDPALYIMTSPQINHDFQKMCVEYRRILHELSSATELING